MTARRTAPGLFLVPSLLSLGNLFCGFMSLVATFNGRYRAAAYWVIFAAVLDGTDGMIARAIKVSSDFGLELDSLADVVSFGLAASLLAYVWGLRAAEPTGAFFAFLFLTAGALRLARYNIRTKSSPSDRRSYQGLTVPSAAVFLCSLVIFRPYPLETHVEGFAAALVTLMLAAFMVSTLRYRNFLKISLRKRVDFGTIVLLAVILGGLIFYQRYFLVLFFGYNVFSGPVGALAARLRKRLPKDAPEPRKDSVS